MAPLNHFNAGNSNGNGNDNEEPHGKKGQCCHLETRNKAKREVKQTKKEFKHARKQA